MDNIVTIVLAVLASTGFWDWMKERRKSKKDKKEPSAVERMVLALVRDKLCFLAKKYIKLGGIPEDELEVFSELGKSYIDSGGNSVVKKLYEQASKLPTLLEE